MKRLIFLVPALIVFGCAATVTRFEQYSMSMNLKVAADSSITIGDDEKFAGVLWLNPILKSENVSVDHVKLIQNFGIYYICADQFKHVWMVWPEEDGLSGEYKSIDVTPKDKTDAYSEVGLSRYGSREKTCVKFKFNDTEVFIDKKGRVNDKCK